MTTTILQDYVRVYNSLYMDLNKPRKPFFNFCEAHFFRDFLSSSLNLFIKARANARNIVGPSLLRALAHHVVCCCVLLRLVGSCWVKFKTGQTSEPRSANISIVSQSSKRSPTMLCSFAQHIQQCCAVARALNATHPHKYMRTRNKKWRRRWKTSQSPLFSHLKTQHVANCCERLHTAANIAQQETTLLSPTMLHVVASVCTGLKTLKPFPICS